MKAQNKPDSNVRENIISISGNLFQDSQRLFREKIAHLVDFRGYETIIIDFSNLQTCFSETILPFISLIDKYKSEFIKFKAIPPRKESLLRTFDSSGWLNLIDEREFKKKEFRNDVVSANFFRDASEQFLLINKIIDKILITTDFLNRSQLTALEWSLNEIMDNVLTHSGSDRGGLVQLTHMKKNNEIEFVVSDCGDGIPNTLRHGLKVQWGDDFALEQSIREGVTRGTGQGNGLFGSFRIATESGGAFTINSGFALLALTKEGVIKLKQDALSSIGTCVRCTINYSKPLVLERALSFNGKKINPTDYIELKYEENMRFDLSKEAISFGNRHIGGDMRRKLSNISRFTSDIVIIDCSECALMSSSFADELFGKLVAELGAELFLQKFSVRGLSDLNYRIVNRSCIQRNEIPLPVPE